MKTQTNHIFSLLLCYFVATYSGFGEARTIPIKTLSSQINDSSSAYESLVISGHCVQSNCSNSMKRYKLICLNKIFGKCSKSGEITTRERLIIGEKYIILSKAGSKAKQEYYSAFQVIEYGASSTDYRVVNHSYYLIDNITQYESRDDNGPIYQYFSYLEFKKYLLKNRVEPM